MALLTNPVDINRGTTGLTVPPDIAQEIFANTVHESAVMRLAERVALPGRGKDIPVITGDPIAAMVNETAEKPVSNSEFATKLMSAKKFAVIELVSKEFARDLPALYDELKRRLPYAIAKAFDTQVFTQAAVTGFDSLVGAQAITATSDIAADIASGMNAVAGDGYRVNGFAVSPKYMTGIVLATDQIGRPLFAQNANDGDIAGRVYGGNVVESDAAITLFGGDWSKAKYGIVDGIQLAISEEATINTGTELVNLWQRNMIAIRCEAELGFVCADADAFFYINAQ